MAIIHQATISPSKLEMLAEYVPTLESLAPHVSGNLSSVGSYRFDDPEGEVGIETHILTGSADVVLQMPLTYRSQPVESAEPWLLGTMEHSVLGTRWIYNGCGDPVYIGELVQTMATGGREVAAMVQTPDGPIERPATVNVCGSGTAGTAVPLVADIAPRTVGTETHIRLGDNVVMVRHVLGGVPQQEGSHALTGTWATSAGRVVLASMT
jgi:hypothetical protein